MDHIIWTSDPDFEDWRDFLEAEYPDENEDSLMDIMHEMNMEYLQDERMNLDKLLNGTIFMYGTLGLWDGIHHAYKALPSCNLNGIFQGTTGDIVTWYVEDGEVKCTDAHHDGTNKYTYRLLKEGYTADDFAEMSWDYGFDKALQEMTEPLGHYVAEIYGFEKAV